MKKPRMLFIDIETEAIKGRTWGMYEQNLLHIDEDWKLLCFAYKWQGDERIRVETRQKQTERQLTKKAHALFTKADIIVAHNGDQFDIKRLQAKFLQFRLSSVAGYQTVDTKKVAKRYFGFTSNSLTHLCKRLGIGSKVNNGGYPLWLGVEAGDKQAWATMIEYNEHDVYLLEQLYKVLLPKIENHPNLALITNRRDACPRCGSEEGFISNGWRYTTTQAFRRLNCKANGCAVRQREASRLYDKPRYK